jgi:Protein of unknown function (DUF4035)
MRIIDVDAMLRGMSWRQFVEWRGYMLLDPFGDRRADWLAAMVMALLANINRDTKRKRQPYTAKDFLPQFGAPGPQRKQTTKEWWANWLLILGDHAELLKQAKLNKVRRKLERSAKQ